MIGTAGAFDPTDRHVYFLASSADRLNNGVSQHPYGLVAVNELNDTNMAHIDAWLDAGVHLLLDSGVFWLANLHARAHDVTMDVALTTPPDQLDNFDWLWGRYLEVVHAYGDRLWGYIELDQGGRDTKRATRALLHELGLRPIPVYHPLLDGWDYFNELAGDYDRVCFGNVVQADAETRRRLIATAWERHRDYPDLWVHLLGLTPNEWLNAWPVDSADSSTWLNVVRWAGHKPSAMLRSWAGMDDEYQYELGMRDGDTGYSKACMMSATAAAFDQRAWRHHLTQLEAQLGVPAYPPRLAGEPVPQPAEAQ